MKNYITLDDVNKELGANWAGSKDPGRCVMIANVWLTNKNLPDIKPIPSEWILAGCQIAKEAANDNIYKAEEKGITSKSVSSDSVSVSKTMSSSYSKVSAGESLANELLKPWLPSGYIHIIKKV